MPRLARRQLRHREHGLAAAARHPRAGHLPRHRTRQAHRVGEPVGRSGIDAQARAAAGRAEHGGVDADEHPGSALGVVADDGVLAFPALEVALEVHRSGPYRSASRLHSAAGMAGERTKLVVAAAREARLGRVAPLAQGGARAGRPLRQRRAGRDQHRRARAPACAHRRGRPALDPRRRDRRQGRDARVDPQGVPGRSRAGRRHARRPARGAARPGRSRPRSPSSSTAATTRRACARAACSRSRCAR